MNIVKNQDKRKEIIRENITPRGDGNFINTIN